MKPIEVCAECFAGLNCCCTVQSGNTEKMMVPPISKNELNRILEGTHGLSGDLIVKKRTNSVFYIQQMINLFPDIEAEVKNAFPETGYHYELETRNHACIFLGNSGCNLPVEIRPHFCRIYPFWVIDGSPFVFQDSECLAIRKSQTPAEIYLCLGTNPDQIKNIYSRICRDWHLPEQKNQIKKPLCN